MAASSHASGSSFAVLDSIAPGSAGYTAIAAPRVPTTPAVDASVASKTYADAQAATVTPPTRHTVGGDYSRPVLTAGGQVWTNFAGADTASFSSYYTLSAGVVRYVFKACNGFSAGTVITSTGSMGDMWLRIPWSSLPGLPTGGVAVEGMLYYHIKVGDPSTHTNVVVRMSQVPDGTYLLLRGAEVWDYVSSTAALISDADWPAPIAEAAYSDWVDGTLVATYTLASP